MLTNCPRPSVGRFIYALSNLKLLEGSPDMMDHDSAERFYQKTIVLGVATGCLGPHSTARALAALMLLVNDVLAGALDGYQDYLDEAEATPIDLRDVWARLAPIGPEALAA
jgi:hypothetical protein